MDTTQMRALKQEGENCGISEFTFTDKTLNKILEVLQKIEENTRKV